jgi:hypothetical protein
VGKLQAKAPPLRTKVLPERKGDALTDNDTGELEALTLLIMSIPTDAEIRHRHSKCMLTSMNQHANNDASYMLGTLTGYGPTQTAPFPTPDDKMHPLGSRYEAALGASAERAAPSSARCACITIERDYGWLGHPTGADGGVARLPSSRTQPTLPCWTAGT